MNRARHIIKSPLSINICFYYYHYPLLNKCVLLIYLLITTTVVSQLSTIRTFYYFSSLTPCLKWFYLLNQIILPSQSRTSLSVSCPNPVFYTQFSVENQRNPEAVLSLGNQSSKTNQKVKNTNSRGVKLELMVYMLCQMRRHGSQLQRAQNLVRQTDRQTDS